MKEIRKRITAWIFMLAMTYIGLLLACEVLLHGAGLLDFIVMPCFFLGCFILAVLILVESFTKRLRLPEKITEHKWYKYIFNSWFILSVIVFLIAIFWYSSILFLLISEW